MSHDESVFQFFKDNFGELSSRDNPDPVEILRYPEELKRFWTEFGFGSRSDGFIWIVNPEQYRWLNDLFNLPEQLVLFARDSFADLHFIDEDGASYFFSPSYKNLERITSSFNSTIMNIADREYTDEEVLYKRHRQLWDGGEVVNADTCYCFSPAIPVGGDEETSEIYVGDMRIYLEILSKM